MKRWWGLALAGAAICVAFPHTANAVFTVIDGPVDVYHTYELGYWRGVCVGVVAWFILIGWSLCLSATGQRRRHGPR